MKRRRHHLPNLALLILLVLSFVKQGTATNTHHDDCDNGITSEETRTQKSLMLSAFCHHQRNNIPMALRLYTEIRNSYPDFAFVSINMGIIALRNSQLREAITLFETYFREVGGVYGDGRHTRDDDDDDDDNSKITDATALAYGTPCRAESQYKKDCVYALNVLASAHFGGSGSSATGLFYLKRAMQIGDEDMLEDVYANYAAELANLGDAEGAADAFVTSFWISVAKGAMPRLGTLIRRAILVPGVHTGDGPRSVEDLRVGFRRRVKDLIALGRYGGVTWSDDRSDLFRVSRGVSDPEKIKCLPPLQDTFDDWTNGVQTPHFYLHYHGFHDRDYNELIAQMYSLLCPESLYEVSPRLLLSNYQLSPLVDARNAPSIPTNATTALALLTPPTSFQNAAKTTQVATSSPSSSPSSQSDDNSSTRGKKLRIAFVSSHFGAEEPHGLLLLDVLRRLPRHLFEIIALGVGPRRPHDDFIRLVGGDGRYHGVGYNDFLAREILFREALDAVVFAEMQNEAMVHFLGYQRFAPVQILLMGAPVTSGNPNVDYFLSGDRLEHPFRTRLSDRQEPYTEQVVLFDGQAISFPPHDESFSFGGSVDDNSTDAGGDDNFGIPGNIGGGAIYMCFQSLWKIQPLFDFVIGMILHADPSGRVVLQAARDDHALRTNKMAERMLISFKKHFCASAAADAACPLANELMSRVIFIPRVPSPDVIDVLRRASVVLHPFPFGGSKTAADVLQAGVPIVTFPQPYLRGRMAANFLTTMELHTIDPLVAASSCCVASSVADYVSKALRLGNDATYRDKVASAIKERSYRIWNDFQTSFEWARFLVRALGVSGVNDDELAIEMGYEPEAWQEDEATAKEIVKEQKRWRLSQLSRLVSRLEYV